MLEDEKQQLVEEKIRAAQDGQTLVRSQPNRPGGQQARGPCY